LSGAGMTKRWPAGRSLVAAALLLGAPEAFAQEAGNTVTLRGFVSQGYLKSSANRFLAAETEEGTFAFTEAALNFSAQPLPKVRIAGQLFARDLGTQGNNRLILDWGLGEYRVRDEIGIRIGRIKLPLGLYNTLADADVTRPEIFQPSALYKPERRDLTNAVDGVGIFGTLQLGGAGYLEYEGLVGTLDLDETYLLTRSTNTLSTALLPALSALRFTGASYVVGERTGKAKHSWGGYVEWHPRVSGLRVRGGLLGANLDLGALTTYNAFSGPAPVSINIRSALHIEVPHQVVLSAEYSRGGLRLSAEHARLKVKSTTTLSGTPFPAPAPSTTTTHPNSSYGQAAYRFNDRLQVSGYYSVSYADGKDKGGLNLVRSGRPAHAGWVKDLAATLRVDVNTHFLVKAEVHRLNGTENLSAAENPKPLDEDWTLFAIKTTLHF
jgi:hypothetical protein